MMDMDITRIAEKGFVEYFKEIEEANHGCVLGNRVGSKFGTSAITVLFQCFWHPRCGQRQFAFHERNQQEI